MLKFGNTYLNFGGTYLTGYVEDPNNPLNLPPYTIRLKYNEGVTPSFSEGTATRVSISPNVWDLTYDNACWDGVITNPTDKTDLIEVMGANTTNVSAFGNTFYGCKNLTAVQLFDTSNATHIGGMFGSCSSLTTVPLFNTKNVLAMDRTFVNCESLSSIPLFDTSKVTNMNSTFYYCRSLSSIPLLNTHNVSQMEETFYWCTNLSSIPLFDTTNVNNMDKAFYYCTHVNNGALNLYNQVSTQSIPPYYHNQTFYRCGIGTTKGQEELAQIPSDWK